MIFTRILSDIGRCTGEVQVHKSEWRTPPRVGLVKTCLLAFYYAITTLFCFLLRYLLRYGRHRRMTFMFFGTFQTASTGRGEKVKLNLVSQCDSVPKHGPFRLLFVISMRFLAHVNLSNS